MADWPKNEAGKPTQAAVFGLRIRKDKVLAEILWTGKFPDLQSAMYWAAKKEVQTIRKRTFDAASRVLWQHDLSPEEAVEVSRKQLEPQFIHAINDIKEGRDPDIGQGPLKEVDPAEARGVYMEFEGPDGKDVIPPFFVPFEPDVDENGE